MDDLVLLVGLVVGFLLLVDVAYLLVRLWAHWFMREEEE